MAKDISEKRFRAIGEGKGGTFTFRKPAITDANRQPQDPETIHHIGTWKCITCVGVWFKIDGNRGFLAHINAYKEVDRTDLNSITDQEGTILKRAVIDRLAKNAGDHNWSSQRMCQETLLLVCPDPGVPLASHEASTREKKTGWWVLEGIREFLSVPASEAQHTTHQGFVVHYEGGEPPLMVLYPSDEDLKAQQKDEKKPKELVDWVAVREKDVEAWEFDVSELPMIDPQLTGGS